MRFGRIGGLLIVGGVALLLIIVATGGPVGIGGSAALSRALILGLVGCGVAVLAWAGPGLLRGRVVRVGLCSSPPVYWAGRPRPSWPPPTRVMKGAIYSSPSSSSVARSSAISVRWSLACRSS